MTGEARPRPPARAAAVAVLDVGRVRLPHPGTSGVDEGVALSALDLLAGVVAPRPAATVELTLWLSSTPAEGRRRPAAAIEHDQRRVSRSRTQSQLCRAKAINEDNLTLLRGMTLKEVMRHNSRGIFSEAVSKRLARVDGRGEV